MSLKSYFPEQFDQLQNFMISGTEIVRCVRIDSEMKPMFCKALMKMEQDPEFPHAFFMVNDPFKTADGYFDALLKIITRAWEENTAAFSKQNIQFKAPDLDNPARQPPAQFIQYASRLAESMPDHVGALIFVIDPEVIDDQVNYQKSILYLASQTQSDWLKFLVLDSRIQPLLIDIETEQANIGLQTFYLSPNEIEKRVAEDLASEGALLPVERRQYKGLLAGFAFARKEYDQAAQLQRAWATEAEKEGEAAEVANAYFNLGNTLLASHAYEDATDAFCKACHISLDNKLDHLAPLVYTNLGMTLHRRGDFAQAFASLKVARDMFKAQNQKPGEAYVVDCLAQIYALDGRRNEAAKAWQYALSIYKGMTSSLFKDLREKASEEIRSKLARLGTDTE